MCSGPLISGEGEGSGLRTEIEIGDTSAIPPNGDGKALVGGLIWRNATATSSVATSGSDSTATPGSDSTATSAPNSTATSGGYALWKLLVGAADKGGLIEMAVLTGPSWPNVTSHLVPLEHTRHCGRTPATGCLYRIDLDPTEDTTLAAKFPTVFRAMLRRLEELQRGTFSPDRGKTDPAACDAAVRRGGYWGPFLDGPGAATDSAP